MKFKDLTSTNAKDYLKLKPGESARGVFQGEPVDFRLHWKDSRGTECPGRATCEFCKEGEKSSFRFRVNFVIEENKAFVAKVFEQGKSVYEALKALNESDYDLEKYMVKITRVGSGTDTVYNVVPVPNGEIKPEVLAKIKQVKLNELKKLEGAEDVGA